ncbi:MAG: TetR/AcrR family transcriptional regulator [Pseudomonadota bacterium]|nr:TetR/AcrR family transcriptional regulator [Pseudomonadota bacterium]
MDILHPAPSVTPAKRARRKQARPGELIEAALALFVEKGYAATRVEEVAAHAGVSKGTLFLYFPSKEELFKAVVHENASRHLQDAFREVAEYAGTSTELLREFIRRWWTQYGGTPAAGLTKLIMSEAANFPDLARYHQDEMVRPTYELVGRIVQRGIESREFRPVNLMLVAHLVMAPLVQLAIWRFAPAPYGPMDDPLQLLELHADMVVRGLKT